MEIDIMSATDSELIAAIRDELEWLNTRGGVDSTHALDTLCNIGFLLGVHVVSEEDEGA